VGIKVINRTTRCLKGKNRIDTVEVTGDLPPMGSVGIDMVAKIYHIPMNRTHQKTLAAIFTDPSRQYCMAKN